jgi:hypothetical protein
MTCIYSERFLDIQSLLLIMNILANIQNDGSTGKKDAQEHADAMLAGIASLYQNRQSASSLCDIQVNGFKTMLQSFIST